MDRVLAGLSPFLAFAGFVVFLVLAGIVHEREAVRADAAALPYLRAATYVPPEGCPSVWDGQNTVPDACAPKRYWIRSDAIRKRFGLPPAGRHADGWFRIGSHAFDLTCSVKTCRV